MQLMTISKQGLELIKAFEGCKLFSYRDSVGVATIGYGHTKNVRMGQAITQQQADNFLREDLRECEKVLNALSINFRQEQFDALCSWIFNLGVANFTHSTMLVRMQTNATDEEVTDQLVRWFNAGGKPLKGLKRRRIEEANMFLGREAYYLDSNEQIKKRWQNKSKYQ
jgi:lysozyme